MSSNHPWRTKSRYFHCEPDCPRRKPGCQDHCEQHAQDRANYDADMATDREDKAVDGYVARAVGANKNDAAIRGKNFNGYAKRRSWD